MTNQIYTYDFTIPVDKNPDKNVVAKALNEWAKKWVFQQEKGSETGFLHWQGRLSLIKKHRLSEVIKLLKDVLPGAHWSITSNTVHAGHSFNYVMKADTRVDGPWKDSDFEEPPPLTRQLDNFMKMSMYPWQETVCQWTKELDDRSIKLVIDDLGNAGKSILAEYLEYKGDAYEIPPFRLMEDIMACVMSVGEKKAYLVDMPRAMKKDKLSEFYSGLESLKNGVCYDKRYSFKKRRMNRPQVIVFTNKPPCYEYMSLDRWEIWRMQDDKSLQKS